MNKVIDINSKRTGYSKIKYKDGWEKNKIIFYEYGMIIKKISWYLIFLKYTFNNDTFWRLTVLRFFYEKEKSRKSICIRVI